MKEFCLGVLVASLLWAGLAFAQSYWGYDSEGTTTQVYPLNPYGQDGGIGWYDSQGRSGFLYPQPGTTRPPC